MKRMNVLIFVLYSALANWAIAVPSAAKQQDGVRCGNPAVKPEYTKIVGGVDAVPYSWPWQVALTVKTGIGLFQICGGTLISRRWVMTAAHCFYPDSMDPAKFAVKIGVYNKTNDDEPGELIRDVSAIFIHPKYGDYGRSYDITLLKLSEPVDYTDHISPICLPSNQDDQLPPAGTDVAITGWGDVKFQGMDSQTLRQTTIPLVTWTDCQEVYNGRIDEPVMFCAGLMEGGKDSCQGDSGGPLVYQDPVTRTWTQLGIVSWGYKCGNPGYYGVYSKVSAYMTFIKELICPDDIEFCDRSPSSPTVQPGPGSGASCHIFVPSTTTVSLMTLLMIVR